MSRTFRRTNQRHEYRWVLRDWGRASYPGSPALLDARSPAGRRAIAKFH